MVDLYVLIFTPLFAMCGFGSRVIWERYTKNQQEIKTDKLSSITFKLNEILFTHFYEIT